MTINPGIFELAARAITVPLTAEAQAVIDNLDGMTAASLEAVFAYGSGGATCIAVVQTCLDGGTVYRDIARFDFTTASLVKVANLSGLLSKAIAAYAALAAEGVTDGFLGNAFRVLITSTGTYVNSTLTIRAAVR